MSAAASLFRRVVFLGTSSGIPTKISNTSCIGVNLSTNRSFLIDCGESTQHTLIRHSRCAVSMSSLDAIFITHLHGDHCFGLFGLLSTLGMGMSRTRPLTIVGPIGIRQLVVTVMRASQSLPQYDLTFIELEGNGPCDLGTVVGDITTVAVPLDHRTKCFGYVFSEADRVGTLDGERAKLAGAWGRQFAQLKAGQNVTLADGRVLHAADFLGPPIPGKKIAVLQDSCDSSAAAPFCHGADLLIHEATFDESMRDVAITRGHSTARMVGEFCARLQPPPRTVALTHISPRFARAGEPIVRKRTQVFASGAESSSESSATTATESSSCSETPVAPALLSAAAASESSADFMWVDVPARPSALMLVDECEAALQSCNVMPDSAPAASAVGAGERTRVILAADMMELDVCGGFRCVEQEPSDAADGSVAAPPLAL